MQNVALSTLAGGPYGAWYYFGPRELGQMVCTENLAALNGILPNCIAQAPDLVCVRQGFYAFTRIYRIWLADRDHS